MDGWSFVVQSTINVNGKVWKGSWIAELCHSVILVIFQSNCSWINDIASSCWKRNITKTVSIHVVTLFKKHFQKLIDLTTLTLSFETRTIPKKKKNYRHSFRKRACPWKKIISYQGFIRWFIITCIKISCKPVASGLKKKFRGRTSFLRANL